MRTRSRRIIWHRTSPRIPRRYRRRRARGGWREALAAGGLIGGFVLLFVGLALLYESGILQRAGILPKPAPEAMVTVHRGGTALPGPFSGRVEYVFDGDTFALAGRRQRIRMWGIDAPETGEPGGPAATAALRALIDGRALACRAHAIDRYGRIVGLCALPDGGDVAARLLATGTVREDCRATGNRYGTC